MTRIDEKTKASGVKAPFSGGLARRGPRFWPIITIGMAGFSLPKSGGAATQITPPPLAKGLTAVLGKSASTS
jgi:hypothetical protein